MRTEKTDTLNEVVAWSKYSIRQKTPIAILSSVNVAFCEFLKKDDHVYYTRTRARARARTHTHTHTHTHKRACACTNAR